MTAELPLVESLKSLARAKVQDVAWASTLKVEDIAFRILELRAAHRFQAEKARREGRQDEAKVYEGSALALLDVLEQFWVNPSTVFPPPAALALREADKALLRARCIEQGVGDWMAR